MRKLATYILLFIFSFGASYAAVAFVIWEADPSRWDQGARIFVLLVVAAALFFKGGVDSLDSK